MTQNKLCEIDNAALWGTLAAILGFLSVAIGAFAAHGLKGRLSEYEIGIVQTAANYQMYHALAILGLSLFMVNLAKNNSNLDLYRGLQIVNFCWTMGIVLFCSSLYVLALTSVKWIAYITPIGGLMFLVAWLKLALVFYSIRKP